LIGFADFDNTRLLSALMGNSSTVEYRFSAYAIDFVESVLQFSHEIVLTNPTLSSPFVKPLRR
jgi:hypothetical protein